MQQNVEFVVVPDILVIMVNCVGIGNRHLCDFKDVEVVNCKLGVLVDLRGECEVVVF